jgi:hypothetical protein
MVALVNRRSPVQVLAQSGAAVSGAADTNENTLATITIPAGAMGANGQVIVEAAWEMTSSANNKTFRIKFGGTSYFNLALTTRTLLKTQVTIANANSASSQVGHNNGEVVQLGTSTAGAKTTSAVDTTAAVTLLITGQKASGAETLTLLWYRVLLYPAP